MNIVSIMNFVRGVEPRNPNLDLFKPTFMQMELNKKYNFPNTFLLQYDAMIREDFQKLFLDNKDENTEIGVWIEVVRPLVEKVGIKWRGRQGYDWDWYVDPGFLPAYTKTQKKLIIDELMEKFKEIFGYYPKTVGSWLLDAYSMDYMSEKYNIKAFAICREQLAVDAYTLWGGPYNQPYYASKYNMLCPAQTKENAIKAPVFRLLGIEPIRGYGKKYYDTPECDGCPTMEPYWAMGKNKKCMEWFFKTYFENENMGLNFTQIGQENSFGWEGMKEGLELQYALTDKYRREGKVKVMKMCDAGEWFEKTYSETPAAALAALDDWTSRNKYSSVWFNNKNYRANLFFDDGKMYFRDIQKFDETYKDRYYDEPCLKWDAVYDNLPVMDERMWSDEENKNIADVSFDGSFKLEKAENVGGKLIVTIKEKSGKTGTFSFEENRIVIDSDADMVFTFGKNNDVRLCGQQLNFVHNHKDYNVTLSGIVSEKNNTITLSGNTKEIIF